MKRIFWLIILTAHLLVHRAVPVAGTAQDIPAQLPISDLIVHTADGPRKFNVELADNGAAHQRGLMFRTSLAQDAGILLVFETEVRTSLWMRNTQIPLDMVFIKADGRILNIHQCAMPNDDTVIRAAGPVRAVLEVNGGVTAQLGIKPGDRVEHSIFTKTGTPGTLLAGTPGTLLRSLLTGGRRGLLRSLLT